MIPRASRIGVPRCSCCGKQWGTGCVKGPQCHCKEIKPCLDCHKCIDHCSCAPVARKCDACGGRGYVTTQPLNVGLFAVGGPGPRSQTCDNCQGKGYLDHDIKLTFEYSEEEYIRLEKLIIDGLQFDGSHHKQWYLQEIAKVLGIDVDLDELGVEEGIAP